MTTDPEELKTELLKHTGNVSLNFKHFEFGIYDEKEKPIMVKFPFQKYRSFERNAASVFYKHISRIINA